MDRSYVLKNWVTVLCAGPVLLMVYELLFRSGENAVAYLETALLFIIFGSIFSLPALLIYYLLLNCYPGSP